MNGYPLGARHLFENPTQIESRFCNAHSSAAEIYRDVIFMFKQKKATLRRALWEVDSLLNSDDEWLAFTVNLLKCSRLYLRDIAHYERLRRSRYANIRQKISETSRMLVKQLHELSELSTVESGGDWLMEYPDPGRLNIVTMIGLAADCQNTLIDHFKSVPCTFRDDLEAEFIELVRNKSIEAMPENWAFLVAFAGWFSEEEVHDPDSELFDNDTFDPIDFSKRASPGDFIRGFTSRIKQGIDSGEYPEKLGNLSFHSIEALAGVLFPNTIIKAGNYINSDWSPTKANVSL